MEVVAYADARRLMKGGPAPANGHCACKRTTDDDGADVRGRVLVGLIVGNHLHKRRGPLQLVPRVVTEFDWRIGKSDKCLVVRSASEEARPTRGALARVAEHFDVVAHG